MNYKKIFFNPETKKEWWIEVNNHEIRNCLNNRKIKEISCDNDYDVKRKASSAMMEKMRKGFIYQNPEAKFGQVKCHRFVGKEYNGFMPIAASTLRDDFFVTRIVGDFEDEILYHFDENGNILETEFLGSGRMTYEQVLCCNETILLNNSYLIEQFSIKDHKLIPFANKRNSMQTMLDVQEELALWYTGEEIVVYDFKDNKRVWSENIKCRKTGEVYKTYYCEGMISPQRTKVCYRNEERGYMIRDLKSSKGILIENREWHPFFSPDDKYFSVGGRFYECETGEEIGNPFPFEIKEGLTCYDTFRLKTKEGLIAIQQSRYGMGSLEIWDYYKRKKLTEIEDLFIVKNAAFEFTKSNLVLHTDYGAVSIYNCMI